MKLTKKGEYALRAMIALAKPPRRAMTITQIAVAQNIPKKFLEQILLALKAAGLVTSRAGPKGGYELLPHEESITVGKILEAVEEPISQGIRTPEDSAGGRTPTGIAQLFDDIRQYVRQKLETVNLDELAAEELPEEQMEALMWYI